MLRCSLGFLLLLATAGHAHEGVEAPAVRERMKAMVEAAEGLRTLTAIAEGDLGYDQEVIVTAYEALVASLTRTPALFAEEVRDPKDRATPAIWADYAGFTSGAKSALGAVESLDLSSAEGISMTLPSVDRACGECHETYRAPKR